MKRKHPHRHGTVIIAALVCLVIVMALLGGMLAGALRIGRQLRVERNARQCELLLLAGLDRAALRAAAGETYMGEVWDVPAAEIGGAGAGQVTIEVSRPGGTSPQFRVLAEYPLGGELSIRRSRTVQMQSTTPLSQE